MVKKILLFIKRKYLYIIVLLIAIIFFIFYSYNNTIHSVAYVVMGKNKIKEEKLIKRIYEECPYEIDAVRLIRTVSIFPENKKDTKKLKKWMRDFKDKNDFETLQIK